jgi:hypothetical protein
VSQLAVADQQYDVLAALRPLKGKATVGDVVAASGLAARDAEAALKGLLESHRGHLAVSDSGELLYEFDPKLIERGTEPVLARLKRGAYKLFSQAFKAWIVVMLVVYFLIFVALVIAAIFAKQKAGGDRDGGWGGGGRRGHGHGGMDFGNMLFWYWIWSPGWRIGRPYYGHQWERTLPEKTKIPFYKKVFAFVFGPDRPEPTRQQLDRSILRLIRARKGVITTAELVQHNALPLPEAEEEMGRLVGAYDGEPVVTADGELAYAFPDLMMSAHGPVKAREPNPAWMRLEHPRDLTGNSPGANALVAGINGFNLLAAVTAPYFIFPRLGIGGLAAYVGLVLIPVVFSMMFFAIPALRMLGVKWENRRRERRNVRRVLLGHIHEVVLDGGRGLTVDDAARFVSAKLDKQRVPRADVEAALHDLAAELDADVETDADSRLVFRFPALPKKLAAGEIVRRRMALDRRSPGAVVYSTADTAVEESKRDIAAFDRELATGGKLGSGMERDARKDAGTPSAIDLRRYLPPTDRVGYEADYEVVAFEEELAGRRGR